MNHAQCLAVWESPAPASLADPDAPRPFAAAASPVLIEVPVVRVTRQARRPSATATARVRASGALRPRRRLRREVRMAGFVFLTIAPLALSALLLGTPGPTGVESNRGQTGIAVVRPPAVWLSIEAPGVETESPVVLPGYLLPDDGTGSEEPCHAGG